MTSADKDAEKLELYNTARGNIEWYSFFGNSLANSQRLPCEPTIALLGIYSRERQTHVYNYPYVHISIIHNSSEVKTIEYLLTMNKENTVCAHNRVLLGKIKKTEEWHLLHHRGPRAARHRRPLLV